MVTKGRVTWHSAVEEQAEMAQTTPPKKKRGGQPGNRNAIKHGFYARYFREFELVDLDILREEALPQLASEVALLRIQVRRLEEYLQKAEEEGVKLDWVAYLNSLGLACTRIATLLKTQKDLGGNQTTGIAAVFAQALAEVTQELKLRERF